MGHVSYLRDFIAVWADVYGIIRVPYARILPISK